MDCSVTLLPYRCEQRSTAAGMLVRCSFRREWLLFTRTPCGRRPPPRPPGSALGKRKSHSPDTIARTAGMAHAGPARPGTPITLWLGITAGVMGERHQAAAMRHRLAARRSGGEGVAGVSRLRVARRYRHSGPCLRGRKGRVRPKSSAPHSFFSVARAISSC